MPARSETIDLPDFGLPDTMPELPTQLYDTRLVGIRERAAERGYDALVIYADREHSANLAWLSGFDPRFEEAILIVGAAGKPLLLTGIECVGVARRAPLQMRVELAPDLSLAGQPRPQARALEAILASRGHPSRQPRGRRGLEGASPTGAGWRHRHSSWTRCAPPSALTVSSRTPATCSPIRRPACGRSTSRSSWR